MNRHDTRIHGNRRWPATIISLGAIVLLAVALSAGAKDPVASGGAVATVSVPRAGGTSFIVEGIDADGQVRLMTNKSTIVGTSRPFKRVSIGQPEIADFNALNATNVLLTAKKPGATQLIIWDDSDHAQVLDVMVGADMAALQDQYGKLFPGVKIETAAANGAVVLRGRVPNLTVAEQAAALAQPYGRVVNFLEVAGGQQVMLQVKFAEVSRNAVSSLGVNFGFSDGRSFFGNNSGQVNPFGIAGDALTSDLALASPAPGVALFGKGKVGDTSFAYFIDALRRNNLLRVLAEPNLIAISGQEASFLAGGEFPIPVTQGGGSSGGTSVTVEFREFGVKLNFVPIVMGDGRVRLKVAPEVSDVDYTSAVKFNGFVVPGLTQRKVSTTVELADGQTLAIAGLLNNSVVAMKDVTPGLGDMPVLGALFRSVRYQRKETELVVMVTPRLVEPMNPAEVPAGPGEKWRHPKEEDLFLKADLGGPAATTRPVGDPPKHYGATGFAPAGHGSPVAGR